ncbi:MAG: hypothetical protein MSN52_08600 [Limosilactobacillus reuteri]|uniref:hypothetical protein n=1 Tax=Limosilactobacillus vaginalis TaxID=1633 RepID=UPI0024BA3DBE|nr:hypothetical protein [Limosilactobacillus vaginalis]MCI7721117.1 hypothetical protein [Limosilactobacillus reuteri]
MNKVFYQNNVHRVSAKVLLDANNLSETQIINILEISHIPSVFLEVISNVPISVSGVQVDTKIDHINFEASDSFKQSMLKSGFDFCVSNLVPNNAGRTYFLPLVNYKDFMELIRLILVHNNQYYVNSNYKVDDFLYLHGRSNYLFPTFQKIWSFAVNYDNDRLYANVLDSIANRFKQLIISFDECSFYCFENRGNDSLGYAIYYFDSFVSQLASIFGNLANTINNFYCINEDSRRVDLRLSTNKGKEFLEKLKEKDPTFYQKLKDTDFQTFLKLIIKPLRNDIEHNNIPQGVNSKTAVSMILSESTWKILQSMIHKYPQECFLDPYHFDSEIYISIYPVLKFLMIFGRKYINYVLSGFNLHWKFQDMGEPSEERNFHSEPNPVGKECENSLYFTTYWLLIKGKEQGGV